MKCDVTTAPLTYIGDDERRGSYVLRITVREHLNLSFGRFKKGKMIDVRSGDYAYIGSAMAKQGATCLAKRLLRHATRSGSNAPHTIRAAMLSEFPDGRLGRLQSSTAAAKDSALERRSFSGFLLR